MIGRSNPNSIYIYSLIKESIRTKDEIRRLPSNGQRRFHIKFLYDVLNEAGIKQASNWTEDGKWTRVHFMDKVYQMINKA